MERVKAQIVTFLAWADEVSHLVMQTKTQNKQRRDISDVTDETYLLMFCAVTQYICQDSIKCCTRKH